MTQELKPLDVRCTSADCENDLHCFKQLQRMTEDEKGSAVTVADLVDWERDGRCASTSPSRAIQILVELFLRHVEGVNAVVAKLHQ